MTKSMKIGGMTCQNCARHVREALEKVSGVESVVVDLAAGSAQVKSRDGQEPDMKTLTQAVETAGYTAG
jgi:copper chaperone CopZ